MHFLGHVLLCCLKGGCPGPKWARLWSFVNGPRKVYDNATIDYLGYSRISATMPERFLDINPRQNACSCERMCESTSLGKLAGEGGSASS
jgi:hypothetical protein